MGCRDSTAHTSLIPMNGLSWFWESQSVGHLSADTGPGGSPCLLVSADGNCSSMRWNLASLQEVIKSNCLRPREAYNFSQTCRHEQTSVGELDHWIRLWSFQLWNLEYEAELARRQQTTHEWKRLRPYNDLNVSVAVHIPQGGRFSPSDSYTLETMSSTSSVTVTDEVGEDVPGVTYITTDEEKGPCPKRTWRSLPERPRGQK